MSGCWGYYLSLLQCGRFNFAFPSRAAASLCYSVKESLSLDDGLGLITNVVAEVDRWGAEPDADNINHSQLNCKLAKKRKDCSQSLPTHHWFSKTAIWTHLGAAVVDVVASSANFHTYKTLQQKENTFTFAEHHLLKCNCCVWSHRKVSDLAVAAAGEQIHTAMALSSLNIQKSTLL